MTSTITDQLLLLIRQGRASLVGIAAHRLADGEEILINADTALHPASTIKLCLMMEVFRQAQRGILSLDHPVAIKNQFVSIADGSPYSLVCDDDSEADLYDCIGQDISRRELVRRMIVASSNLATNILIEQVQPKEINEFMRELGAGSLITLRGMEDKAAFRMGLNNSATARGLMQLLIRLARGDVISLEASEEMIGIMGEPQLHNMIQGHLPADVRVAHKWGSAVDYFHDVGIVYPSSAKPFVLAILTKGYGEDEEKAAHAFVAALAKAVYDYWNPQ